MTARTVVDASCPQCGTLVSRSRPHTCHARPVVAWPSAAVPPSPAPARPHLPKPLTDPVEVRERIAACRAALEATRPPESAPAASTSLYRERPYA